MVTFTAAIEIDTLPTLLHNAQTDMRSFTLNVCAEDSKLAASPMAQETAGYSS